jgi:hypothetical protein
MFPQGASSRQAGVLMAVYVREHAQIPPSAISAALALAHPDHANSAHANTAQPAEIPMPLAAETHLVECVAEGLIVREGLPAHREGVGVNHVYRPGDGRPHRY